MRQALIRLPTLKMLAETQLFLSLLAMLILQIDNTDELVDTDVINSFLVGVSAVCTPMPMVKFVQKEMALSAGVAPSADEKEMTDNPLADFPEEDATEVA